MSEVQASHLLCKHTESRTPISRRTGEQITMSKADAHAELTQLHTQLKALSGQELYDTFSKLSFARSDCGSFRNNGDLGPFGRGAMQKPFEDGTFALSVGQMSGIVDTDSGLHLILRTA